MSICQQTTKSSKIILVRYKGTVNLDPTFLNFVCLDKWQVQERLIANTAPTVKHFTKRKVRCIRHLDGK